MAIVEMTGITKRYGGLTAVDQVTLKLQPGRVHSVVGENGAGKTTLMKVLQGVVQPDEGEIRVGGEVQYFKSPRDAFLLGIGMVYQHFMLVPSLTVAENLTLGNAPKTKWMTFDRTAANQRVLQLCEKFGFDLDPNQRVEELSVGEMQRLEVLRALDRGARILLLDEPTAVLTPQEADSLLDALTNLAKQGTAVVFISHKIREVLKVSDDITVMRGGVVVGNPSPATTSAEDLASLMVGRRVELKVPKPIRSPGPVVLDLQRITVTSRQGRPPALDALDLQVRSGEVLGIAGVEGNGQSELAEVVVGLRKVDTGVVEFDGHDLTNRSVQERHAYGLGHIPEDRNTWGASMACSLQENAQIRVYRDRKYNRYGFLKGLKLAGYSADLIREADVRGGSVDVSAASLSGGNLQKLIVGRELQRSPKLVIAAQPTRGIDIGAIEVIHDQIRALADSGTAVLLISAELDEIFALADRIVVLYEGKVALAGDRDEFGIDQIGQAMTGKYAS